MPIFSLILRVWMHCAIGKLAIINMASVTVLSVDANPLFPLEGLDALFRWYISYNNQQYTIIGYKTSSTMIPLGGILKLLIGLLVTK